MGVVNVTPDSFSDGGKYYSVETAVAHALAMAENTGVPGRGSPARDGTGKVAVTVDGTVPHCSGALAPVPRGSKLTTSVAERTSGGSSGRSTGRI